MNSFVKAVNAPRATRTTNGMPALTNTGEALTDFFFKVGASRNLSETEIQAMFMRAFGADKEIATRILLWARDIRGGAGERRVFRELMLWLEKNYPAETIKLLPYVSEFGRWDDLLIFKSDRVLGEALKICALALRSGDGLAAKWMPRKGLVSAKLRTVMGMSPKAFRKMLVGLTNVVETKMCAQDWNSIEFGKLPSLASKQYQKAFGRHAPEAYTSYIEALKKGDAKINANAIFPHDVIVGLRKGNVDVAEKQWDALPNFMSDIGMLPVVDVSLSMTWVQLSPTVQPLDVAIALGLYMSDKNKGPYKDLICTFSTQPVLESVKGDLRTRYNRVRSMNVSGSTDIEKTVKLILDVAVKNEVPQADMPKFVVIFSDMQFNECTQGASLSALDMMRARYRQAGYEMPAVVFWNLNSHDNVPAKFNEAGVMLVSGFSPAILKSILSAKTVTPYDLMMEAVNVERYDVAAHVWA